MTDRLSIAVQMFKPRSVISWRRIGGLHHWRIGSFGGSFYGLRHARFALCTVAALAAACTVPTPPRASHTYSAVVTLADGNEYVIEHDVTLADCRAVIADMSETVARCESGR